MTYVSENFWHDAVNKATTDLFTFGYKHIIKPHFIFNQTPDVAHSQMIDFCKVTRNIPPLMWLCREMLDYTDPILETNVMGVDFANPFGLSAGLDKDCEMPVLLDNVGFGFETVGSTTSRPCPGNPRPWFHRLPEYDSMMVHVGLANEGSAVVIPRAENAWTKAKNMQVSVSIARCMSVTEPPRDPPWPPVCNWSWMRSPSSTTKASSACTKRSRNWCARCCGGAGCRGVETMGATVGGQYLTPDPGSKAPRACRRPRTYTIAPAFGSPGSPSLRPVLMRSSRLMPSHMAMAAATNTDE